MNILHTTDCPKCKVLEAKLQEKKIEYITNNNLKELIERGIRTAPILEVDGVLMEFSDAVKWVNNQ